MKNSVHILKIVCMIVSLYVQPAQAEDVRTYTIGIIPQFEIRHLRKIWIPILNELEKETGHKLEFKGSPTIPDFEKELNKGNFDFAYINPYLMILSNKSQGYVPLIRDVGNKLYGILVVKKSGNITSVEQLQGKKIAFPAPNALGASLLIKAGIKDKFNIDFEPVYVKTHSSVYLNVIVNQTAAGGGVQKTLDQQREHIKSQLRILYRSPSVPTHPIVVHPSIPKQISESITRAFTKLGEHSTGKALLLKIPIKDIGPANLEDYKPLSQMGLEKFYVN